MKNGKATSPSNVPSKEPSQNVNNSTNLQLRKIIEHNVCFAIHFVKSKFCFIIPNVIEQNYGSFFAGALGTTKKNSAV